LLRLNEITSAIFEVTPVKLFLVLLYLMTTAAVAAADVAVFPDAIRLTGPEARQRLLVQEKVGGWPRLPLRLPGS